LSDQLTRQSHPLLFAGYPENTYYHFPCAKTRGALRYSPLLAPSRISQILSFFVAQLFVCFSRHASVFLVGKGKRDGGDGSRQYLTQEIFTGAKALFSSQKFCKIFSDFSSHQIFGHMHEALNIDKK
jgi:hypothetical protein